MKKFLNLIFLIVKDKKIPTICYLPKTTTEQISVVLFSRGHASKPEMIEQKYLPVYKDYCYLADYFTNKGYAFISI